MLNLTTWPISTVYSGWKWLSSVPVKGSPNTHQRHFIWSCQEQHLEPYAWKAGTPPLSLSFPKKSALARLFFSLNCSLPVTLSTCLREAFWHDVVEHENDIMYFQLGMGTNRSQVKMGHKLALVRSLWTNAWGSRLPYSCQCLLSSSESRKLPTLPPEKLCCF